MPFTERPLTKWYPYYLADSVRKRRYYHDKFTGQPIYWRIASTLTALPTAAITQVDQFITPAGNYYELYQTTEQTKLPELVAGGGYDIACDEVNNETLEIVPGGIETSNVLARVIGTDPDFFVKATFTIDDASGSDQFLLGFRKQEAYAVPTSFLTTGDGIYTDFFGVGFAHVKADPNPIYTAYDLNNSGSTTVKATGMTWADTLTHTLEIRVIGRRCYVYINGCILGSRVVKDGLGNTLVAPFSTITGPNFSFDAGDTVVPFIFVRQDGDVIETLVWKEFECGDLRDIGLDKGNE